MGYDQNLWFHTTFVLRLDDNTLVRARDVYLRVLHDIHEAKDAKEANQRFKVQLRRTIGDDNYKKLMESVGRNRFFSRKNLRIFKRWRQRRNKHRKLEGQ